uniref:Uncharacterized protein n=1 Tax=Oryza meridionalis TaxID=40149 RepID=A0A0E0D623_9ORYZ
MPCCEGTAAKPIILTGLIPSICLFYRLTCSDLVPSSGLCTQELLARFPLHFSLSSISDDEQPKIMEINYFFYKICLGEYVVCDALGLLELLYGDVSVDILFEVLWGSWSCSSN